MNNIRKRILFLLSAVAVMWTGCSDQWDDEDVSGSQSQTLWEVISSRSDLSSFQAALKSSGFDELLQSSGSYTVLAPVNAAMAGIESDKVGEVPGAHIAMLEYAKAVLDTMVYLPMYNGKLVVLDSMQLTSEEIVCRNGVLRFAGAAKTRQPNIYESLYALAETNDMAAFIVSLGDSIMDMERSVQVGVDASNQPVYDTVMTYYNPIFERVPLNDNDSLVSLVLLDNETFATLSAKYWPYFKQNDGKNPIATVAPTTKIDSAATTTRANIELVADLTCYLVDAVAGTDTYTSTGGVKLSMEGATVTSVQDASNGTIQFVSGVDIRIKDNKIKDVYIEGENYYYTNERYVFTRIVPSARGGKDVVVCGSDSVKSYYSRYTDVNGEDSIVLKSIRAVRYYDADYAQNSYPQANTRQGGPVIGYKVPLYSCNYKIYWRSVDDRPHHCQPDSTARDYDYQAYLQNKNLPMAGVLRHVQKMYFSQPGDTPLEYVNDYVNSDFVANYSPAYPSTLGSYRCMADYDPEANVANEVGKKGGFARLGINAGFAVDDPTYESPLIWCSTDGPKAATLTQEAIYYSGITNVSTVTNYRVNNRGQVVQLPQNIFVCFFEGEATVFVTGAPFNEMSYGTPTLANGFNYLGSIFLDYIHFVPEIDE